MKEIGKRTKDVLHKLKTAPHHVKNKITLVKHDVNRNLTTVQDFMWETFKQEPADLGTFGGKGIAERNPNVRNIELRRFDDIDKAGRFWKCMSVAFLKETIDKDLKQFKRMKNHDVKLIKKGDLYLIVAAEKGVVWGRKK
jgi:hypothetical protein